MREHDPNRPTAMQAPFTDAEKWAEADGHDSAMREELRRFYWKCAGRPHAPEESYLPRHLWRNA